MYTSAHSCRTKGGHNGCCAPALLRTGRAQADCGRLHPARNPSGPPQKLVRTCGTLTDELLALGDWLTSESITHVALEATGSYWKAVWNMLEGRFELLLVNTQHIKAVPGRKTDVKDAEWIADLLRHGLLKP